MNKTIRSLLILLLYARKIWRQKLIWKDRGIAPVVIRLHGSTRIAIGVTSQCAV